MKIVNMETDTLYEIGSLSIKVTDDNEIRITSDNSIILVIPKADNQIKVKSKSNESI